MTLLPGSSAVEAARIATMRSPRTTMETLVCAAAPVPSMSVAPLYTVRASGCACNVGDEIARKTHAQSRARFTGRGSLDVDMNSTPKTKADPCGMTNKKTNRPALHHRRASRWRRRRRGRFPACAVRCTRSGRSRRRSRPSASPARSAPRASRRGTPASSRSSPFGPRPGGSSPMRLRRALVMPARAVAGGLDVEAVVDAVDDDLGLALRLHVAAHDAEGQPGLAVLAWRSRG